MIFLGLLTRFVINSKNQQDALVVVKEAQSKQLIDKNMLREIFPWLVVVGNFEVSLLDVIYS